MPDPFPSSSRAFEPLLRPFVPVAVALAALLLAAACTSSATSPPGAATPDAAEDAGPMPVPTADSGPRSVDAGPLLPLTDGGIGGDRPVEVLAPGTVPAGEQRPLVVLLHPYGFDAKTEDGYLGLSPRVLAAGGFFAAPSGLVDGIGKPYWNGTDACCDLASTGVDDSGYVRSVIRTILASYPIDPKRVWVFGHSNGAFLAHRIACDEASLLTGIIAMAGATFADPARCKPDAPLHVLTIHGNADKTILYQGGFTKLVDETLVPYPGALETASRWAGHNGCTGPNVEDSTRRDYSAFLEGSETTASRYEGCKPDGSVEHWRLAEGSHTPVLADTFWADVFRFMAEHPRL